VTAASPAWRESEPEQLDLFDGGGIAPPPDPSPFPASAPAPPPAAMTDAALIAAIPDATQSACYALADEAARRKLAAAVPALESLCRRFKGFGLQHAIPEQLAALQALAMIGGADAADALRRIIVDDVVAGPGLSEAVDAAAALRCVLPEPTAAALLCHPDPATRAHACRCTPRSGQTLALLVSLLDDLNPGVATEAAKALARMGRSEGRPRLLRCLGQHPDAELLAAVAAIADDECTVLLGRVARAYPELCEAALDALESIETPRAAAVLAALAAAGVAPGQTR